MKLVAIVCVMLSSPVFGQGWTADMQKLAVATECKYGLPSGTCHAFSWQESNDNPFAERVEGHYVSGTSQYAKNIRASAQSISRSFGGVPSYLTEVYQQGKSVSQFQIMFVNIRDMGFRKRFASELTIEESFEYFGRFVSRLYKKHRGNIANVASEYNGGSRAIRGNGVYRNQEYVTRILRNIKKFG